jgi:ActD protein/heat induced stress protein YflT
VNAVYGLYADADGAQRAVDRLRAAGVPERDITIVSSEPIEEYEFSARDKATWLHWIAGAGGGVGLLAGLFLTTYTQRAWPIQTGGMPIVTWWPNLIIMFEMTMLGAILATVITLFITAKIPLGEPTLYDPAVSDGHILVGVERPRSPAQDIQRALSEAGPIQLKTV